MLIKLINEEGNALRAHSRTERSRSWRVKTSKQSAHTHKIESFLCLEAPPPSSCQLAVWGETRVHSVCHSRAQQSSKHTAKHEWLRRLVHALSLARSRWQRSKHRVPLTSAWLCNSSVQLNRKQRISRTVTWSHLSFKCIHLCLLHGLESSLPKILKVVM